MLAEPSELAALGSVEAALMRLPPVPRSVFFANRGAFLNPAAPRRPLPRLHYPHANLPRTAILGEGFRETRNVRCFPAVPSPALARYRPQALAGPVAALRDLAHRLCAGEFQMRPVTHAVIALTHCLAERLDEEDRDLLWRVFRVPVYQQVLGLGRELLACECDAHTHLHVCDERAVFESVPGADGPELVVTSLENLSEPVLRLRTGIVARVETSTCPCGARVERLIAALPARTLGATASAGML